MNKFPLHLTRYQFTIAFDGKPLDNEKIFVDFLVYLNQVVDKNLNFWTSYQKHRLKIKQNFWK
jgi:hypothetical protein